MLEYNPHERQPANRARMLSLSTRNNAETMAKALKATRDTMTQLEPMQPPNLNQLMSELETLRLNAGSRREAMTIAVDTLTDSWLLDKTRCNLIIAEWCL